MTNSLNQLNQSALALLDVSTMTDVYKTTLLHAKKIAQVDCGSIFYYRNNNFHRMYSCVEKEKQGIPTTRGFSYRALITGKPQVHTPRSVLSNHPEMYKKGVRGIVVVPLHHKKKSLGVLTLQSYRPQKLRKEKLDALQILAAMASISIRKKQIFKELKETIATRDLFISIASHEFKNPVAIIHMYSELIKRNVDQQIMPKNEWVDVLITESSRMNELITELLSKEKFSLTDIHYNWQKYRISHLLEKIIENYQTLHPKRKFALKYNTTTKEDYILTDKNKFQQVVTNLLNNSVKFSSENQPIYLSLEVKPSTVALKISDHGKGIAKKHLKKLFGKFYKIDKKTEGMGLGLFVAKNIIDKHHGKIIVTSQVNNGTTFTVVLPKIIYGKAKN